MWLIGPIRGQYQCHVIINWPMTSLVTDHRSRRILPKIEMKKAFYVQYFAAHYHESISHKFSTAAGRGWRAKIAVSVSISLNSWVKRPTWSNIAFSTLRSVIMIASVCGLVCVTLLIILVFSNLRISWTSAVYVVTICWTSAEQYVWDITSSKNSHIRTYIKNAAEATEKRSNH